MSRHENAPVVGGQGAGSNEAGSFDYNDLDDTRIEVDLHEAHS